VSNDTNETHQQCTQQNWHSYLGENIFPKLHNVGAITQDYRVYGLCPSSSNPSVVLEYWTIDKVQKRSNHECYKPSSEPFKISAISMGTSN
jgi:hypothetical protein